MAAVLRPGTAPASLGARGILRRLLRKLRTAFPAATFRVRLDGGFASPKLFRFLEREQVEYVVAMASNRRLEQRAQRLMGRARVRSRQTGETAHLYGETRYAATKWAHKRRVVIKAEVVRHPGRAPKNNPRFVVTNLTTRPQAVYEFYCQRGDVENRLKELHHGLDMDHCRYSSVSRMAPVPLECGVGRHPIRYPRKTRKNHCPQLVHCGVGGFGQSSESRRIRPR